MASLSKETTNSDFLYVIFNYLKHCIVDPWRTWVWTAQVHLYMDFSSNKYYSTTQSMVGWTHVCGTMDMEGWLWDLGMSILWYMWQFLETIPRGYQGMTALPKQQPKNILTDHISSVAVNF